MRRVSERRLAENEAVFRRANERVLQGVAELDALALEDGQPEQAASPQLAGRVLHFYCECSNADCVERVKLTISDYEQIHKIRDHFVISPGHDMPAIERVIVRHDPDYHIVEKLVSVPLPDGL